MKKKTKKVLKKYGRIIIGGLLLFIIICVAVFARHIATHDPYRMDYYNLKAMPNETNIMGTDSFGRDIFSRLVYGTRISLIVGFAVSVISIVFGIILGLLAGYYTRFDKIIMRVLEGFSAMPQMLLALVFVAVLGSGIWNIIMAISIVSTPNVARLVRSQVLSIKESEHVESAVAMGASDLRIIFKYVLPLCVSPLIIRFTATMASAILTETSLSFLGVGVPPETPSWGGLLNNAKDYVSIYPHMAIYPGLAIVITVFAVSIMGDGLRDVLDPKLR